MSSNMHHSTCAKLDLLCATQNIYDCVLWLLKKPKVWLLSSVCSCSIRELWKMRFHLSILFKWLVHETHINIATRLGYHMICLYFCSCILSLIFARSQIIYIDILCLISHDQVCYFHCQKCIDSILYA